MNMFNGDFYEYKRAQKPLHKVPKSVQETIDISHIAENGIFLHGVEGGLGIYTRLYEFVDINYSTADTDEAEEILVDWCKFLNSMTVSFKWIIQNQSRDVEKYKEKLKLVLQADKNDTWRTDYNQLMEEKLTTGKQGIDQRRYLIVQVKQSNFNEASAYFSTLESNISQMFHQLKSELVTKNAKERLEILHKFYRMGKEDEYTFDWKNVKKLKLDWKNTICNTALEYSDNYIKDEGKYYRTLFVKEFPTGLLDNFVKDICDLPQKLTFTVDIVPVPKNVAIKGVLQKLTNVENEINQQQRTRNKNRDFSTDITWEVRRNKEDTEAILDDLRGNDQNLFFVGVCIVTTASSLEELEANTRSLQQKASSFNVLLETHTYNQREALNTAIPIGVRQTDTLRTLLTNSAASLVPFNVRELAQLGGIYYGINQLSKNLIIGDRKKLMNSHGWIFGISGSGKSVSGKNEITQVYLRYPKDDIIILDPKNEYLNTIIKEFDGTGVNISSAASNHLNPLAVDNEELRKNPQIVLTDKVELMLGICAQATNTQKNTKGSLEGDQKSIIDRCISFLYSGILAGTDDSEKTMVEFYNILKQQPEEIAQKLALTLEIFITGTLNIFAKKNTVDTNNHMTAYCINDLGDGLRGLGMLITLEWIKAKVKDNYRKGKYTWIFIDEIHNLLKDDFSAEYLSKFWKEMRQFLGICTGITQNIDDVLQSYVGRTLLANSEYICILKQAPTDRGLMLQTIDISEAQLKYVTNSASGTGLLKFGNNIVPFDNRLDKESSLYQLFQTSENTDVVKS